jgi:LmbE family N-acetylglucosaminyl deacetylase
MLKNKRIMTVLAHEDDETLGCGGTLHRFNDQPIQCIIPIKRIEEQCKGAFKTLGIPHAIYGNFDDNQLDKYPLLEIVKWVSSQIDRFNPDVIITHNYRCANQDHRVLYEASCIATRPLKNHITLLTCEVLSSTCYLRPTSFEPNFYVELSPDDIVKKMKAVEDYVSELRKCRSPEVVSALARVRGAESGYDYAEGFQIIRNYE